MAASELAADPNVTSSFWTPGERGRLTREQGVQPAGRRPGRRRARLQRRDDHTGGQGGGRIAGDVLRPVRELRAVLPRGAGRGDAPHERTDRAGVRTEHHLAEAGRSRTGDTAERTRRRPMPSARVPGGGARGGPRRTRIPRARDRDRAA